MKPIAFSKHEKERDSHTDGQTDKADLIPLTADVVGNKLVLRALCIPKLQNCILFYKENNAL